MEQDRLNITLPSLSDITKTFPSALEVTLNFKNGFIESTDIKQIVFEGKNDILSDIHLILPENRKITRTNKENNDNENVKKLTKTMNSFINK